jgi:hypothetical protein
MCVTCMMDILTKKANVEAHLRHFMIGKKGRKTLENARFILQYFDWKRIETGNRFGLEPHIRRSKIFNDLVLKKGVVGAPRKRITIGSNEIPISRLFKNENSLARLLQQLVDSRILRRRERIIMYPRSRQDKQKMDVDFQLNHRIYYKNVTKDDEIQSAKRFIEQEIYKRGEAEYKLYLAFDLLRQKGMEDPEKEIEKMAKGHFIVTDSSGIE